MKQKFVYPASTFRLTELSCQWLVDIPCLTSIQRLQTDQPPVECYSVND